MSSPRKRRWKRSISLVYCAVDTLRVLKIVKSEIFTKRKQLLLALEFEKCVRIDGDRLSNEQINLSHDLMNKIQTLNEKARKVLFKEMSDVHDRPCIITGPFTGDCKSEFRYMLE